MSDAITIQNGGEAPHAAKGVAGPDLAAASQGGVMQQNGGAAPDHAATAQPPAPGQTLGILGISVSEHGGDPPLGGVVHAP